MGCPAAFGYGLHAFRLAPDRPWACAALGLSGAGLLAWVVVICAAGLGCVVVVCVAGAAFIARGIA